MRRWLTFIILSLALSAHATNYFEVNLVISQTNFNSQSHSANTLPTSEVTKGTWSVSCLVGPDKWMIESHFASNVISTYYFDGTNVLEIIKLISISDTDSLRKILKGNLPVPRRTTNVTDWCFLNISPGAHPLANLGANLPWLAYCSGNYLRDTGHVIPLPGAVIRHVQGAFGYASDLETFDDPLGLPKNLVLSASKVLFASAVSHESLIRTGRSALEVQNVRKPVSGIPEGFIRARYSVLAHTNFDGRQIPISFTYEQYLPATNGASIQTLSVHGLVVSLKSALPPELPLLTSQRYSVVDYRFQDKRKMVDEIHYSITNGKVEPRTNFGLQQIFAKSKASSPLDPVIKANFGIYLMFIVLVMGPVLVAIPYYIINKNKTKRK